MGKIVSRGVVSASKESIDVAKGLSVNYCLCGEFLLVLNTTLSALPVRPTDGSLGLRNTGESKRVYKLNTEPSAVASEAGGVLVRRGEEFEYQRRLHCPRCALCVGYETHPGVKGDFTYLLKGALTDTQGQVPKDALGAAVEPEV